MVSTEILSTRLDKGSTYKVTVITNSLRNNQERGEEAGKDKIQADEDQRCEAPFGRGKADKFLLVRARAGGDDVDLREFDGHGTDVERTVMRDAGGGGGLVGWWDGL